MGAGAVVTVIGLGSLLSERSARATFPTLRNFRLGRVYGYRRCFAHPAGIFFTRGIADLETKQIASLSAEPCEGSSFVCTVFEVEDEGMDRFREREEEFELVHAPVHPMSEANPSSDAQLTGLLCCRSTDDAYIARWGEERFEQLYRRVGVPTIWGYAPDSGLRPCAVYLRHCVLAAQKMGDLCLDSFLDDTFLIDRTTTLREYLAANPQVMATLPPPDLQERYGG